MLIFGPLVAIALYFSAVHLSGGAFPAPSFLGLGGDKAKLRATSLSFMQDIEYKDFDTAASYHSEDTQESVDIPFLIQRLFQLKPETMDIMEYQPVFVKIDSSGLRARVKMRVKIELLVNKAIDTREIMLFYYRESADSPWFMKLEDSLRSHKATKGKKH